MKQNFSKVLFFPLVVFIIAIAIVSVGGLFLYENKHIESSAQKSFINIQKKLDRKFEKDVLNYEIFIKLIRKDQKAIELFSNSKREELYDYYKNLYSELNKKYNISHFYFHKTNQVNFLRVHNPKKHSDFIDRYTLKDSINTKDVSYGVEFGISHNLTLRVVYPWLVGNKIIGYIELGKEIDYFTPEFVKFEDFEIIYTINKDIINKKNYHKWLKHSKNNQNFKELDNYFIIDSSIKDISNDILNILNKKTKIENITVKNNSSVYKAFNKPFYDVSNKRIGNLFIFYNITDEYNFLYSLFRDASIVILILLMILLSYYYKKLKKTEKIIDDHHQEIFAMSITDSLSKLHNKRYFDQVYTKRLNGMKNSNNILSLLIIDIDNFKKYNDLYGHQEGDEVIKKVASTIKYTFKRTTDDCFRVGGEEFVVLTQIKDEIGAKEMADTLRKNIEALEIPHEDNMDFNKVTISIGIYIIKENNISPQKIYKYADEALYTSKQNGRNKVTVFE